MEKLRYNKEVTSSQISKLKHELYNILLKKPITLLTKDDVNLMYVLSKDKEIQETKYMGDKCINRNCICEKMIKSEQKLSKKNNLLKALFEIYSN